MRRVYQRGVVNPMVNIEIFWKDYCTYENVRIDLLQKSLVEFLCNIVVVDYLFYAEKEYGFI